jgi:hypothetical protein
MSNRRGLALAAAASMSMDSGDYGSPQQAGTFSKLTRPAFNRPATIPHTGAASSAAAVAAAADALPPKGGGGGAGGGGGGGGGGPPVLQRGSIKAMTQ